MDRFVMCLLLVICREAMAFEGGPSYLPPSEVSVKPVFLVPQQAKAPSDHDQALLQKHLELAKARYREMLGGRSTFKIADGKIDIIDARHPLAWYRDLPKSKDASAWVSELLDHYGYSRFNCPYIFLTVVANSEDRYPVGGGRPFNGGIGTGGGVLVISSFALKDMPNFQSTLQHELGHTFGLPHVDVYGYDMKTNASIMSYNPNHKTNGFQPGRIPGILIPEDIRALALNDRCLADLTFDLRKDVPRAYKLSSRVVPLGPMDIDSHPAYAPVVSTTSGNEFNTTVANIVAGQIEASRGPEINFNPKTMWHSSTAASGIVTIEIRFPVSVELSGLAIHSEHSGKSHRAVAAQFEAQSMNSWQVIAKGALTKADDVLEFPPAVAQQWRLQLKTGPSRKVVLRGLRFICGDREIFPQLVPWMEE